LKNLHQSLPQTQKINTNYKSFLTTVKCTSIIIKTSLFNFSGIVLQVAQKNSNSQNISKIASYLRIAKSYQKVNYYLMSFSLNFSTLRHQTKVK
jgi:hypothetical protein